MTIVNEMIDDAWLSCQIRANVLKVFADIGITYALQTKGIMMRTSIATSMLIFFLASSMLVLNTLAWADDPKPVANPYLGTWRMVAVIVDGKDLPPATKRRQRDVCYTVQGWFEQIAKVHNI